MAAPPQPVSDIQIGAGPLQVGDQIMVGISLATKSGVNVQIVWPIDVARNFSKAIKNAVQQAEVTVVKPPSLIVP